MQGKVLDDVEEQLVEQANPEGITLCPDCKSPSVIHYGKRGKRVLKQIMLCKDCGRQFTKQQDAFTKLQSEPRIISLLV